MNEEMTIEENKEEETAAEETVNEETVQETAKEAAEETAEDTQEKEEENSDKDEEIHRVEVAQPSNIEAIVEGLLYVVGEDGVRIEQLALVIERSLEDPGKHSAQICGRDIWH